MALVAFTSLRSPGTTTATLAAALTWPRASMLVEADPVGSALHTGFLRSRGVLDRGLFNVGLAGRRDENPRLLLEQATQLDEQGQRLLVTGLTEPAQAASLVSLWPIMARMLRSATGAVFAHDVLVDVGRLGHRYTPSPVLQLADAIVVFSRAEPGELHGTLAAVPQLRGEAGSAPLILLAAIGSDPDLSDRRLQDLARGVGCTYAGAIPWDVKAADQLAGRAERGRGLERSALMRGAQTLATNTYTAVAHRPPQPRLMPQPIPPQPLPPAPFATSPESGHVIR
jgi:hypothetical protein